MSDAYGIESTAPDSGQPIVREINRADVWEAYARGMADFKKKPSHIVFLCLIYPIVAFFMVRLTFQYDVLPLLFPLVAGYAILGPIAATGLYEISRRLEKGGEVSWKHAFGVLKSPSLGGLVALALVLTAIFLAWLWSASFIFDRVIGTAPASIGEFVRTVVTTPEGWTLIIVGCGVGFVFAVISLAIGVVSFPMLLDRKVSATTALLTSFRAVAKNPQTMMVWGFFVAGLLVMASLPFFIGLAVVLPVLGHSTWHLYRRTVVS